jgi:hypothetical protein
MILVGVAAMFYFALGVRALLRPKNLLAEFKIFANEDVSRNEIRAVYGGFPLAASGLLIFSLWDTPYSDGILFAVAVSTLGMAVGRIVSAAIDGALDRFPAIFIGVELVIAACIAAKLMGI